MKLRAPVVLILLISLGFASATAKPESWTPTVEFHLEDADFEQTLAWVSGWSFALTSVGREQRGDHEKKLFCLPHHGNIESRVMLDALNRKFRGQRITSEQAASELWREVKAHYRCD